MASNRPTGQCAICGDPFAKVNKVRKYCLVCQGIRDVTFAPKRHVDCISCGTTFWPLKSNYTMCNDCREPSGSPDKYVACTNCNRHLRPAPGLTAYCLSCVQSSQDFRNRWLVTVVKLRTSKMS